MMLAALSVNSGDPASIACVNQHHTIAINSNVINSDIVCKHLTINTMTGSDNKFIKCNSNQQHHSYLSADSKYDYTQQHNCITSIRLYAQPANLSQPTNQSMPINQFNQFNQSTPSPISSHTHHSKCITCAICGKHRAELNTRLTLGTGLTGAP